MVKAVQLLAIVTLYSSALVAQATQLLLQVQNPETELGRPVIADLYAVGSNQSLDNIDIRPLHRAYDVIIRQNANIITDPRWPGKTVQHLKLELYPGQTGQQTIPSLSFDQAHSAAVPVRVMDGKTLQGPIDVSSNISHKTVWQRQQLVVTMTIKTPDRYTTLQAEKLQLRDVEVVPLPARREFNPDGGSTLQIGWALFPLSAGQQQIKLPAIEYRLSGVVQRRYYLPPLAINVRKLPVYLPPTIPVGRIKISSNITPGGILQPQRLAFWQIRLQGDNVSPLWLPPVLRQLKSNQAVTFLPARSERNLEQTQTGIASQVTHEVPFRFADSGRGSLPGLRVQYFDPDTARLETVKLMPQSLWLVGMGWRILSALLLLLLIVIMARKVRDQWAAWRYCQRLRRNALVSIENSQDVISLRQALRQLGHAEGWPANLSLSGWLGCWQQHYTGADEIRRLIDTLNRLSYDRNPSDDIKNLKTALYTAILQAKPRERKWSSLWG